MWNSIRAELAGKRRRKRVILYGRAVAAVLLALAFVAGWYFYDTSQTTKPQIAEMKPVKTEVLPETKEIAATEAAPDDSPEVAESQISGQLLADAEPAGMVAEKVEKINEPQIVAENKILPGYADLTESPELKEIALLEPEISERIKLLKQSRLKKKKRKLFRESGRGI